MRWFVELWSLKYSECFGDIGKAYRTKRAAARRMRRENAADLQLGQRHATAWIAVRRPTSGEGS